MEAIVQRVQLAAHKVLMVDTTREQVVQHCEGRELDLLTGRLYHKGERKEVGGENRLVCRREDAPAHLLSRAADYSHNLQAMAAAVGGNGRLVDAEGLQAQQEAKLPNQAWAWVLHPPAIALPPA